MPKSRDRGRAGKLDRRSMRQQNRDQHFSDFPTDNFAPTPPKKRAAPLEAKTEAQGQLIASILSKDITLITGPAGTGKTYVSIALAAEQLAAGKIEKLVFTRPMKGCDEDMGFLPGEENEKYAPWVEPMIDVLEERLGKSFTQYLLKTGRVQCKALQFMRGKSWKDTWVILDEAQNTTPKQMKMFLTRIGENSKLIIDGDVKQGDIEDFRGVERISGLQDATSRLRGIPEIGTVEFTLEDIVRHGIVRKILERYE